MPAYTKKQKLIDALTQRIQSGTYPPGTKLPSGTELCAEFDVSRQVVRAAIDWLKARGLVDGAPGAGVFVRDPSDR
ncbi:winged helix-turn-helix domain-containing protein [Solwaraspora sp. WMMD1047]|uniref:winged helix-turn-helix domain-containing protein n=1 Tax=Solwaraspora sp. WMMD1047 TaxID=3016102 RepID=UPI002417DF9C|nr:winged helix-turn-helix domain-containing protein [Solwaraspora sp. WMMD1047]MDG4833078.1 winged helix-turn-helix domain-containing protein [Solwaraspora sp. WMMD1047]